MKISDIAKITGAKTHKIKDMNIKRFIINSKEAKSGDFFVPLKGSKLDGHDFIEDALNKGAYGSFSSKDIKKENILLVEDTLKALTNVAKYKRKSISTVIGITGTSGKTTTKELANLILSQHFKVSSTLGNYNNHIGLPLSLANCKTNSQVGIYELGTSQKGDIKYLMDILTPDIGVLTSVGYAHTQGFKSFEDIVYEKGEIFKDTKSAVLPDNLLPYYEADLPPDYITFGIEEDADIVISNIKISIDGTYGEIKYKNEKIKLKIPVINEAIFMNLAAVSGILYHLGLNPIKNLTPAENFSGIKGRGKLIKTKHLSIIDDSYNANPLSVYNAIKTLSKLKGKKILVLGDMLELGDLSKKLHKEIGTIINRADIDEIILYGEETKYTKQEIKNKPVYHFTQKEEIIKKLQHEKNAIILIKGSRGMKLEEVIEELIS